MSAAAAAEEAGADIERERERTERGLTASVSEKVRRESVRQVSIRLRMCVRAFPVGPCVWCATDSFVVCVSE